MLFSKTSAAGKRLPQENVFRKKRLLQENVFAAKRANAAPNLSTPQVICDIINHVMDDLLRIAAKLNIIFGVIVIALSAFSYFIESILESDMIAIAARFSIGIAIASILTGILGKLCVRIKIQEEHPKAERIMRGIGLALAVIMLLIAVFGIAIGLSTGTLSYLYFIMVPLMLFYCTCIRKPRPKSGDMQKPGLQLEHDIASEVTVEPPQDI